jgi:hypothetical protein
MSRRRNKSSLINVYALLLFTASGSNYPRGPAHVGWYTARLSASESLLSCELHCSALFFLGLTERHYLKAHAVVILCLNAPISLARLSS